MAEWIATILAFLGLIFGGLIGGIEVGRTQGAIAAHKGEIVCINIPFKEDRWECGEP